MRPVRLELEGFTAFREPTVVDFEGVDLFALTGATGSGKTSLLDAMVFALYGNVPRLADQRAVAPVIAQGMAEAKVRFDFMVGSDAYAATRVVRRTKGGGATTPEARLEMGGETLAGTADELTAAVTERLGLSYEHFTKCVVLPQGEFARFLHDKPAARQDLLVSLLDLGVYETMADLAGKRHAQAKSAAGVLEGRLSDVANATPEAIAAATERVGLLTALLDELDVATPELAALDADLAAAADDAVRVADETELLMAVRVPADLAALHDRLTSVTTLVERTTEAVGAAEMAIASAEDALGSLGDRAKLHRWLDAHDRGAGLRERRSKGQAVVTERTADLAAASQVLLAADAALESARLAEESMAAAHRAHVVRADLVAGEECPVCLQTVSAVPKVKAPPAMGKTRTARDKATHEQQAAADAQAAAARALAVAEAKLADIDADLVEVDALLVGSPDRTEVQRLLEAHAKATADVDAARAVLTQARAAQTAALADRDAAVADEHAARVAYDDARDALAALKPPSRRRRSSPQLLDEWTALAEWAEREATTRRDVTQELEKKASALAEQRSSRLTALAERCASADLVVPKGSEPASAAREALGRARADHETVVGRAADAQRMRAQLAEVENERDLAHGLALHLNASHFEKWLLDEAMTALADGATELLMGLSGDQYSLRVDSKNGSFVVVDHRNADEVRSARTLSGGETFLASLALALALADRIASLAARGAARLESIFLDEGFGSLDPDTLDVVASAIEELGAGGRVVAVVSHVAELAERLPVRYEVQRAGNASTVERLDR